MDASYTREITVVPLAIRSVSISGPVEKAKVSDKEGSVSEDFSISAPPDSLTLDTSTVDEVNAIRSNWLPNYPPEEVRDLQLEDPDISPVMRWLENEIVPLKDILFLSSPATKSLWLCRLRLSIIDGVMYYIWLNKEDRRVCLVVPEKLRKTILSSCHDSKTAGHLGQNKTSARVKKSFYWYNMGEDIILYVRECDVCSRNKSPANPPRAALRKYHSGYPMERVHMDVLGPFVKSALGNKYILVMVDQFTKWVDCAAIPEQSAETVAIKFIDYFISPLGIPVEINTDQGSNFESHLFKAFCSKFQIAKTRTTPYHPSSNGQVERYNQILLPMIRSFIEGNQNLWDRDLSLLVMSLHATVNRQTGFTPNRLMLGREVFQPVDVVMGTATQNVSACTPVEWANRLKVALDNSHRLVRERLNSTQRRQKQDYDLRKLKENFYQPGDLVYRRDQATKKGCSTKLFSPYKGPFLILKLSPPLYTLQERKRESVLHHDKLIPCHSQEIPLWLRRKRHNLFCDENQVSNLTETSLENADFPDTEQNLTLKEDVEIPLDQSKLVNDSHSEVVNESSEQETPTAEYPCGICNLEIYDHDSAIQCDGDCDK